MEKPDLIIMYCTRCSRDDVFSQILTTVRRFHADPTTGVRTWSTAIRVHVQLAMFRTTPALNA